MLCRYAKTVLMPSSVCMSEAGVPARAVLCEAIHRFPASASELTLAANAWLILISVMARCPMGVSARRCSTPAFMAEIACASRCRTWASSALVKPSSSPALKAPLVKTWSLVIRLHSHLHPHSGQCTQPVSGLAGRQIGAHQLSRAGSACWRGVLVDCGSVSVDIQNFRHSPVDLAGFFGIHP